MTQEDWEREVLKSPDDLTLRLAFADWLEEEDLAPALAKAQRLFGEGKRPFCFENSRYREEDEKFIDTWRWYSQLFKPQGSYTLPDKVFESLKDCYENITWIKIYLTRREAEQAVIEAIEETIKWEQVKETWWKRSGSVFR